MTLLNVIYFFGPMAVFLIILVVVYFKTRPDGPTLFDEDINQAAQQAWQAGREDAQERHTEGQDR